MISGRFAVAPASIVLAVALGAFTRAACADDASEAEANRVAALEKALTNATLIGHFTVTGREDELTEERYELGEMRHLGEGLWLIEARIKYGDHDVTLPITLPIHWAGDTPVITVEEVAFPGLGTYSARVMIHRDHYAGFWTGKDHGGHLFGVVERGKEAAEAERAEGSKPSEQIGASK